MADFFIHTFDTIPAASDRPPLAANSVARQQFKVAQKIHNVAYTFPWTPIYPFLATPVMML